MWFVRWVGGMVLLVAMAAQAHLPHGVTKQQIGTVRVVSLVGTYHDMGKQYGELMRDELRKALGVLQDYYVKRQHFRYEAVVHYAGLLFDRFPSQYQQFIDGVAIGAGISLNDAKVLNGMETLGAMSAGQTPQCAFLHMPGNRTYSGMPLIGRNYDYAPPFDQLSQFLTVTILHAPDKVPTAFIAIAGEIYCPTCINANGVFMELNNGMPSGGFQVNVNQPSILSSMLAMTESGASVSELRQTLDHLPVDYSLIVNVADESDLVLNEYSTTLGMKYVYPSKNVPFVSTNYYVNPSWKQLPEPTDAATWVGVTRRQHLLNQVERINVMNLQDMQHLMDLSLDEGGAVWPFTIYQLIYDMRDRALYVKVNKHQSQWVKVELTRWF